MIEGKQRRNTRIHLPSSSSSSPPPNIYISRCLFNFQLPGRSSGALILDISRVLRSPVFCPETIFCSFDLLVLRKSRIRRGAASVFPPIGVHHHKEHRVYPLRQTGSPTCRRCTTPAPWFFSIGIVPALAAWIQPHGLLCTLCG
jgi:hypothetical protein